MSDEDKFLSLEQRVSVIEQRLGIEPAVILAGEEASAEAGAEAHVGNPTSDVAPPAVPDSAEDALEAANAAESAQDALDHVTRALQRWPEDEDLLKAKGDLESLVAEELEAANAGSGQADTSTS